MNLMIEIQQNVDTAKAKKERNTSMEKFLKAIKASKLFFRNPREFNRRRAEKASRKRKSKGETKVQGTMPPAVGLADEVAEGL
jgi:hypothetical protein